MRFEKQIDVTARAEAVWAVYVDVERWPEWTDSITSVELLDPAPLAVGSRARIRQPRLPVAEWTVTEMEPGRSFTWTATGPGVRTTGVHRVDSVGEGARATAILEQAGPGGALVGLLTGRLTRRYLSMELEGLKARAEGA